MRCPLLIQLQVLHDFRVPSVPAPGPGWVSCPSVLRPVGVSFLSCPAQELGSPGQSGLSE